MTGETKNNSYIYVTEFTTASLKEFKEQFYEFSHNSLFPVIPIFIDSYGGEVYSLFGMIDIIETAKKPVMTVGLAKCMSCAALLLAAGTKNYRFISPRTTVMFHSVSDEYHRKDYQIIELQNNINELKRLEDMYFSLLGQYSNKTPEFYKKLQSSNYNQDIYLTPEKCKEYNIIDFIQLPEIMSHYTYTVYYSKPDVKSPSKTTHKRKIRKK